MKAFTDLIRALENTTKTSRKMDFLVNYFQKASDEDKVWTIALFTHRRPRRQINTRLLADWAMQYARMEPWLFDESYGVVGDLAETIALILPPSEGKEDRPLTYWIQALQALSDKSELEKKDFVTDVWKMLPAAERFVFNKLITGGFRVGVSHNLMYRALAQVCQLEPSQIAHRLVGDWDPGQITFYKLLLADQQADPSRPYPFYLAYPVEGEVQALGSLADWQIEWKWDGIRSQLIKREGQLFLWSRGEELITEKFPEFHAIADHLPDGIAIDGELLAYKEGRPLPFSVLQTRIGRKKVARKHLREAPAAILAYDLMEYQGQDIRDHPLEERRKSLIRLLENPFLHEVVSVSRTIAADSWEDLATLRAASRAHDAEGFMVKRLSSTYKVGRKRGDWWKWKVDPFSIDAVMIYAQKGHGKRADVYSDYTFAVWSGDELVPFAKAYSGLTDEEIGQVTRFVQKNTRERFGPVRTVSPELVFEIHFEAINASTRHKSGLAVRFPRIHRWRKDKKPEEANTLDDLKALL